MSGYDFSQDVANELLESADARNDLLKAENAALQSKVDALVVALDNAAKHVRQTCFALYDELQAAISSVKGGA